MIKATKSLKQILMLNIIFVSSEDFNSNIAKIGNKLGYGKEFLQEMFKQKMD